MTMTTTFKPNYKKAEQEAYKLLTLNKIDKLPIKVKSLVKHFPNLKIKKYSWYAKKHKKTIEQTCEELDSNEGCCWLDPKSMQYIIFYNDQVENTGRMRWTIAHEIGHFILKHNELSNKTIFNRNSLTKEEYDVYEKEANCFARTLLAPPHVISNVGKIDVFSLSSICEISVEAANNIISFLKNGQEMGFQYSENYRPAKRFSKFIFRLRNKHYCQNCITEVISESKLRYCPYCGDRNIYKSLFLNGDDPMKYQKYPINTETGRPYCCPRCENEEVEYGVYCKICGIEVVNKCANRDYHNGEIVWECGQPADGDARYCTSCGHTTTYYEDGLLTHWESEKEDKKVKQLF